MIKSAAVKDPIAESEQKPGKVTLFGINLEAPSPPPPLKVKKFDLEISQEEDDLKQDENES